MSTTSSWSEVWCSLIVELSNDLYSLRVLSDLTDLLKGITKETEEIKLKNEIRQLDAPYYSGVAVSRPTTSLAGWTRDQSSTPSSMVSPPDCAPPQLSWSSRAAVDLVVHGQPFSRVDRHCVAVSVLWSIDLKSSNLSKLIITVLCERFTWYFRRFFILLQQPNCGGWSLSLLFVLSFVFSRSRVHTCFNGHIWHCFNRATVISLLSRVRTCLPDWHRVKFKFFFLSFFSLSFFFVYFWWVVLMMDLAQSSPNTLTLILRYYYSRPPPHCFTLAFSSSIIRE